MYPAAIFIAFAGIPLAPDPFLPSKEFKALYACSLVIGLKLKVLPDDWSGCCCVSSFAVDDDVESLSNVCAILVKYLLRAFAICLGLVIVQSSTNNLSVCEDLLFTGSTSLRVFQNLCRTCVISASSQNLGSQKLA